MKFAYPVLTEETRKPSLGASGKYENILPELSAIGYDAVELLVRNPEKIDTNRLSVLLDEFSLQVASVGTGPVAADDSLTLSNPNQRFEAVQRATSIIDLAAIFECSVSFGKFRGSVQKSPILWNTLISNLHSIVDYAAKKNVEILFESQNKEVMDHLTHTTELVDFIDSHFMKSKVNVMVDIYHVFKAGESIRNSLKSTKEKLAYVHISDTDREIPGEGDFNFTGIFTALKEVNYKGYIAPEIKQSGESMQAASRSLEYLKQYV